ncbi:hypothetical protein SD340_004182 [Vibrio fluvialis]|nr:hypothetical protein [Vibrio fluvialis]ELU8402273.1 hypothetical protein [Vibrio fluvialis]
MDWLSFISDIVGSLAWPIATIVIVFVLRQKIESILNNLKKVKAGPLEAEFERQVESLRISTESYIDEKPISEFEKKLYQLSEINPRSAILEAWQGIEASARRLVIEKGLYEAGPESRPLLDVFRALSKNKLISEAEILLFHELRGLRNSAAHDESFLPTKESALNYVEMARGLRSSIEKANKVL